MTNARAADRNAVDLFIVRGILSRLETGNGN